MVFILIIEIFGKLFVMPELCRLGDISLGIREKHLIFENDYFLLKNA
ncbi:MAG: hypothetical protein KAX10_08300 [Candidatus Lokiarchaeota archaeon]|nr:hypothetical protein [Candidatus Lokiarchaeota archaeon]